MQRLATTLALGVWLLTTPAPSGAATSGRLCRRECAPRIAEQCAGRGPGATRRCRRPLIRACKQTNAEVACPTTADVTRQLGDRRIGIVDGATSRSITLCASGDFSRDEAGGGGVWSVRITDGALALELDDATATLERLRLEREVGGDLLVDGLSVTVDDASEPCREPGPAPEPAPEPDLDQTLVALARSLADRTLAFVVQQGARIEKHELTLCSAGGYTLDTVVEQDGVIETVAEAGTWTLRADGARALLELQAPARSRAFAVTLDAGGATLLDGATVQVTDGRATCEPAPQGPEASLEEQLETALGGTAFFFVETSSVGGIPLRVKIGFCASGRHIVQTTNARRGPWDVRVENGTPVLELADDAGSVFRTFAIGFDANGEVLLDGQHVPVDEPSLVEAACQ